MASSDSRSQVMKLNSRALITAAIRKRGPMSRVQLATATDISRTHVSGVVDELIADGTLVETGSVIDKPGRPRILLRINPEGPAVAGVWLAEEAIRIAVAGPDGEVLARYDVSHASYGGVAERAIAAIAEGVRRCADRAGRPVGSLQGLGVAVCGYVDPMFRMVIRTNLDPCFVQIPIASMLGDELGVPVYMDADIRASAMAHNWYREGEERALYLWFLDGIGAAYVSDHQLFGAAHNLAPSIGHMIMEPDGPLCHCGRRGCLEAYTTTYAFIRYIWPDLDSKTLSTSERRDLVRQGMDLAVQGDPTAIRAFSSTVEYLSQGLANSINMLDPQVVYIGGVMIEHSPEMVTEIIRRETIKNINRSLQGVEIKLLTDLGEFGLQGALGLALLRPYRELQEMTTRMLRLNSLV